MGGSFSTYQRDEIFFINSGDDGMLENQRKGGKFKNTLRFKGADLMSEPLFMFRKKG
jgi:hypothetical protein